MAVVFRMMDYWWFHDKYVRVNIKQFYPGRVEFSRGGGRIFI